MSTFAKPATPTKSRSNNKPATPGNLKQVPNANTSSSSSGINTSSTQVLEDINVLLHLEAIKRNKDSLMILKQKIEESYKLYEERRCKYFNLVAKYAELIKLADTRKVLLRNDLIDLPIESASVDAKNITEKLSSGSATDYISTTELNKFKEILLHMEKFTNLPIKSSELANIQNATETIQYALEAIEISLEKCTTQGLDHFVDILDVVNYPKLFNDNEDNEH